MNQGAVTQFRNDAVTEPRWKSWLGLSEKASRRDWDSSWDRKRVRLLAKEQKNQPKSKWECWDGVLVRVSKAVTKHRD